MAGAADADEDSTDAPAEQISASERRMTESAPFFESRDSDFGVSDEQLAELNKASRDSDFGISDEQLAALNQQANSSQNASARADERQKSPKAPKNAPKQAPPRPAQRRQSPTQGPQPASQGQPQSQGRHSPGPRMPGSQAQGPTGAPNGTGPGRPPPGLSPSSNNRGPAQGEWSVGRGTPQGHGPGQPSHANREMFQQAMQQQRGPSSVDQRQSVPPGPLNQGAPGSWAQNGQSPNMPRGMGQQADPGMAGRNPNWSQSGYSTGLPRGGDAPPAARPGHNGVIQGGHQNLPSSSMAESQMLPSPGLPTGPGMQTQQHMADAMSMAWGMMSGMAPGMGMGQQQQHQQQQQQPGPRAQQHQQPQQQQGHFNDAVSIALQKFAAAAEVQKAATGGPAKPRTAPAPRPTALLAAQQTAQALAAQQKSAQAMAAQQEYDRQQDYDPMAAAVNQEMMMQQRQQAMGAAEETAARLMASGAPVAPAPTGRSDAAELGQSKDASSLWPGAMDKRYEGRVKTFNLVSGFGFIQCQEMHQLYGCDAFLNTMVAVAGTKVSFSVEIKNGKPQARNVVIEEDFEVQNNMKDYDAPGTQVPGNHGQVHRGRVKSFNGAKGFGFIAAPRELQHSFGGRDIYVSKTQAPDGSLQVGQEVEFHIVLDRQGQPQARDITIFHVKRGPGMPSLGGAGMPLFS